MINNIDNVCYDCPLGSASDADMNETLFAITYAMKVVTKMKLASFIAYYAHLVPIKIIKIRRYVKRAVPVLQVTSQEEFCSVIYAKWASILI